MKYIRTKDGILENSDYYFIDNTCEESYKSWNGVYYLSPKDIIEQADTIEELCDYAVAVLDKIENPIIEYIGYGGYTSKKEDFNDLFENDFNEEIKNGIGKLYGAIWTDKGLIYVAKMNDKGELELL